MSGGSDSEEKIRMQLPIRGGDFSKAGEASSKIKNILKQLGVSPAVIKRVAIACFESEINIVAYANKGQFSVDITTGEIRVLAKDEGPGIECVEMAMMEGFSTAPPELREMGFGAGMGLPNIKKAVDWMKIESQVGVGTELEFKILFGGGENG
ncbi:MAG TPA: ATP-binding protein [bacterium]|nr:ATP-binding protein [bacterium]